MDILNCISPLALFLLLYLVHRPRHLMDKWMFCRPTLKRDVRQGSTCRYVVHQFHLGSGTLDINRQAGVLIRLSLFWCVKEIGARHLWQCAVLQQSESGGFLARQDVVVQYRHHAVHESAMHHPAAQRLSRPLRKKMKHETIINISNNLKI